MTRSIPAGGDALAGLIDREGQFYAGRVGLREALGKPVAFEAGCNHNSIRQPTRHEPSTQKIYLPEALTAQDAGSGGSYPSAAGGKKIAYE